MEARSNPEINIKLDVCRLARFGANITDAHSCMIFLPSRILSRGRGDTGSEPSMIELAGYHSLSRDIIEDSKTVPGTGLIGWAAKHRRSIHVSPFEHDSRTLGTYRTDQGLKSFIGIPILLDPFLVNGSDDVGVIACDSKKSFAFSKLQGKLLEDLAREVSNTVKLCSLCQSRGAENVSFAAFMKAGNLLLESLGINSVEVVRLKIKNFEELEHAGGTGAAWDATQQIYRLIQQTLPPHFPSMKLPQGDIIMIVDNMVSSFYENKVRALCKRLPVGEKTLEFECLRRSFRDSRQRPFSLERLITETTGFDPSSVSGAVYEYRRA